MYIHSTDCGDFAGLAAPLLVVVVLHARVCLLMNRTPGLHNKISAKKIFARGWVAQKLFVS